MTKTPGLRGFAAIGGLTATIALLTGLPPANADELADLRANQELLQRRIDQLAQAQIPATGGVMGAGTPAGTGAQAAPGVPSLGGSFPRSFLIPGTDTSIRIGGFIDLTGQYFLQGGNTGNPGTPSSNAGQNGNLNGVPVGQMFVPGIGSVPQATNHSRGNGFFEFSPQQSRLDIETRTPTAWGEARTFFAWDFAGCNPFSCQTRQQDGGDSILPRLRFAYGALGGFLGGQALSNFSDADADTESVDFGGAMGGTGGLRIPQVRYTIAGPWGSAWSVSAEQPFSAVNTPGGILSSDSNVGAAPGGPGPLQLPSNCIANGVNCTTPGVTTVFGNLGKTFAPILTAASYWAQPWGHVDFAGVVMPQEFNDGAYIDRKFIGYGGHFSGDVKPGWFGYAKDDFLFSVVVGNGLGPFMSGGWSNAVAFSSNFTAQTQCATPMGGCIGQRAASNILFKSNFGYSTNGGYQHWWAPNLRSTIAAGIAHQDLSSQLIGPNQASTATKEQWNAFVNLVWNPVAFITTGIQYMYGKRIVVANGKGQEQVLTAKWRVAF
jgi:hypothetical protein